MSDLWVVNASPIIVLAKIGRLSLLEDLCDKLLVPKPVVDEILAGPPSDPARLAVESGWGNTVAVDRVAPELLEWGLGPGETAVLAVATERRGAVAVLDDAAARTCSRAMGIRVIGSIGAILRAKRKDMISSAGEVIVSLREAGLRLDDNMVRSVLERIGETWPPAV